MLKIENKKAFFDFEILEKYEAGIMLEGNEVKSIRKGKMNLKGSFCKFFKGGLYLMDAHISKYESANTFNQIDEKRSRQLLMHKKQLVKLESRVNIERLTIVPLKVYLNEAGKFKIEIGLAKGKKLYDKRADDKEKTLKRESERY